MLFKQCPKCKKIISQLQKYCDACADKYHEETRESRKERVKKSNYIYNKKRNPKYGKFYKSKEWVALRGYKLAMSQYICEECKQNNVITIAEEIHHIIPISEDWNKRLELNNLQALCLKCHNKKHGRFIGKRIDQGDTKKFGTF